MDSHCEAQNIHGASVLCLSLTWLRLREILTFQGLSEEYAIKNVINKLNIWRISMDFEVFEAFIHKLFGLKVFWMTVWAVPTSYTYFIPSSSSKDEENSLVRKHGVKDAEILQNTQKALLF